MEPTINESWPEYCCAIIRDHAGRYLLEERPPDTRLAAGKLTCFGGRREPGEHPDACIARELLEELGLRSAPADLGPHRLTLRIGPRRVAWFYTLTIDAATTLQTEAGRQPRWIAPSDLAHHPLSEWHIAAIAAVAEGKSELDLARPV
ncbi:MAG: NUDIX hydrolase [Phycisphaerales bacterium]